jgi:hypothetical protein
MNKAEFIELLDGEGACSDGITYVQRNMSDDLQDGWKRCQQGDLMAWYLIHVLDIRLFSRADGILEFIQEEHKLYQKYFFRHSITRPAYMRRLANLIRKYYPTLKFPGDPA